MDQIKRFFLDLILFLNSLILVIILLTQQSAPEYYRVYFPLVLLLVLAWLLVLSFGSIKKSHDKYLAKQIKNLEEIAKISRKNDRPGK